MIELKCKHCSRHLGEAETLVAELNCPNCKGSTQFKILSSESLYSYKFATPEKPPKKKEPEVS